MTKYILTIICHLLPIVMGQLIKPNELCVQGCFEALSIVEFNGTSELTDGYYIDQCSNQLRLYSIYICSKLRCSESDIVAGVAYYNQTCKINAAIALPDFNIISNFTSADIAEIRVITYGEVSYPNVLSELALPSDAYFTLAYDTVDVWNAELRIHEVYGWAMYGFWAIVVTTGIGNHVLGIIATMRKNPSKQDVEHGSSSAETSAAISQKNLKPFQKIRLWTRKYLIVPATFGYHCSQPVGWCTVPPRIQALTLLAFVVINVVLCSVTYHVFDESMYFNNSRTQLWRYISDRTGIICFANLPLLWIFSSRNNFLLWATGWDFATFNRFHRWVARVALVEAVIHSIGYTVNAFLDGGKTEFVEDWTEKYWYWGVIATIVMCLLSVVSLRGVRERFYEIFLYLHIGLSTLFLVGCFYHVSIFDGQYNGYLWPCVAIWVVDRLARIARIMLLKIFTHKQQALAVYCADSDTIRLDVFHSRILEPHAGSYYFVYVFNGLNAYESHPFTLASWQENSKTVEPKPSVSHGVSSRFQSTKPALLASEVQQTDEVQPQPKLSFIIRPRNGFTSRLRDSIIKSRKLGSPTSLTVLAEGPYGSAAPVHRFQNILLIVGGSGVTVALSYLQGIFENISDRGHGTNIHVIWTTRQRKFADEIVKNDMQRYYSRNEFKLDVHITSCSPTAEIKAQPGTLNFYEGRPNIKNIILREAEKHSGKVAVLVCGPPQLADDARSAVVIALKRGYHWVEFFEQGFSW